MIRKAELEIVAKVGDIPAEAGRRRLYEVDGVRIHFRALELYNGTDDEFHLHCCGLEIQKFYSSDRLTPEQILYLLSRLRGPATTPTGHNICVWKDDTAVNIEIGDEDSIRIPHGEKWNRLDIEGRIQVNLDKTFN